MTMTEQESQLQEIESRLDALQAQVDEIVKRNQRVEGDKAWETSLFRVMTITTITYLIAAVVMWAISISRPFFNALIPTMGYFLSTQSLPWIKKRWIAKRQKAVS